MSHPQPAPTVLISQGLVRGVSVCRGPTLMPHEAREVLIDLQVQTPHGPMMTRLQLVITPDALEQLVRALRRVKNEGGHEAQVDA